MIFMANMDLYAHKKKKKNVPKNVLQEQMKEMYGKCIFEIFLTVTRLSVYLNFLHMQSL